MKVEEPIRIAFCHYTSDVCGGSDHSLFDLVTRLDRSRFTAHMLLKRGDPMAAAYRALGLTVGEIPFVPPRRALEWRKLAAFGLTFGPHAIRAASYYRQWDVDLVHVNTLNNLQGAAGARLARKPLIWHVRELVPDSRAGTAMRALVPWLADRAVANSTAVAASLAACGARLHTVHNGVDLSGYPEPDPGTDGRSPRIVCVGRLEPWKGQHVLVEAAPTILAQHPQAEIWFVGGPAVNKPDYLPSLEQRCRALGVQERIRFTGIRDDIPAVLGEAAVLVLPSVSPEPFGRTLIEAMAACCPVVATAAGGPLDILADGKEGRLVPPDDAPALAAAVSELLADPAQARAMGRAGRARVLAHFTVDQMVARMSTIFTDTVRPCSRGPE